MMTRQKGHDSVDQLALTCAWQSGGLEGGMENTTLDWAGLRSDATV